MKIVAIVSGGMDSATLIHHYLDRRDEVKALGFDYGQRHRKELEYAWRFCEEIGVPFDVAHIEAIRSLIAGQSSQTNPTVEVPDGHYADLTMKTTIVPNRNMIMLSIAIGHAISLGYDAVAYGAHAGDHTIYPDCRELFAAAMAEAAKLCDWREIKLLRPFIEDTKADVAKMGAELGVNFSKTWSCYKGLDNHCGLCGTCVERREAFEVAGVDDPTLYEAA